MFSRRVPGHRQPNRITSALAEVRARGREPIDLTVTNPTLAGVDYPPLILEPLGSSAGILYQPAASGLPAARAAVAADYARRGLRVPADRIVLTASTSEAYALLFKLLCDPGDEVLVPVPSYPLFDHLTQLEGIRAAPYVLEYHGRWTLDPSSVERAWSPAVRAVLAVSPNNPTGSVLTAEEIRWLSRACAARGAALILDEVFADYPLVEGVAAELRGTALPDPACLIFRLGGLSKSSGLPQVKLGWIAVDGPATTAADALDRLELIADTYLSVSTPVQIAAASLMEAGATVREQIHRRVRRNHCELCRRASGYPSLQVLPAQAGWSGVIRVPSTRTEENFVLELIGRDDVVVHPGFFFDFPGEAFVVVSLLPEPAAFDEGVRRVMERANA